MRNRIFHSYLLVLAAAILAALLSSGCGKVLSLQPLYSAGDPVPAIDLAGRWTEVDGESVCTVTEADGGLLLSFIPEKDGQPARYRGRPVAIGNTMFLDLTTADELPEFAIPGHWLAKLEHHGNEFEVSPLDSDWVVNQCAAGRLTCITVSRPKDENLVITSPPALLRNALLDPGAFSDPGRFRRSD